MKIKEPLINIGVLLLLGTSRPARENNQAAAQAPSASARGNKFDIDTLRLSLRVAVFYGDPSNNGNVAIAAQKGMVVVDAPFSKTISQGFRDAIQSRTVPTTAR
jgi:hypothetical protein